jgi:hypothetical protein
VLLVPDLLAAASDQPLIASDQRHIGIDEHPSILGRYLHVQMQMIGRRALAPKEVADLADHLAFEHEAAAHHAVGVELLGQHVQVPEADALVGRVGHDIERLLAGRAQHRPVATTSC